MASDSVIDVSIVVPMYNESDSVKEIHNRLTQTLLALKLNYEIVFVNDFSTDNTLELIKMAAEEDETVVVISLLSNFGQTPALAAGIDYARGEVIIPMDGDLQHAPEDIPAFLEEIKKGYDIVSGWRAKRVDNFFMRRLPSIVANKLMSILSGIKLHDFGTTYKAYRKEVIKNIRLYGDFHRFIPVLCKEKFKHVRIKEIPIKNIVRPHGQSNYNLSRTVTVLFDLVRLKFLTSYRNRPLHIFGTLGFVLSSIGSVGILSIIMARVFFGLTITGDFGIPIFILFIFSIIFGFQFILSGLMGEMLVKNHFDLEHIKPYIVESVFTKRKD